MAASAPGIPGVLPEVDNRCNYRTFRQRAGGKVPCVAIGQDLAGNHADNLAGEITGITFQKVDLGVVKAVLPSNEFAPLDWPNAPTRNVRPGPNLVLGAPPQAPNAIWQEFASTVLHTRTEMLSKADFTLIPHHINIQLRTPIAQQKAGMKPVDCKMTPPVAGSAPPDSLLEGIHENIWRVGNNANIYSEIDADEKLETIKNTVGANWSNNRHIEDWAYDIVDGLSGATHFQRLFDTLYPNSHIPGQKVLVAAPRDTSKNKTIRQGVVHCLPFGFYETQQEEARQPRARRRPEYISNRILLPKRLGNRERSRSRSPVSDGDESTDDIVRHVRDTTHPPRAPPILITVDRMLENPASYVLKSDRFFHYFEPHKPDFLYCSMSTVESDEKIAGVVKRECSVKLLVEISSQDKYGPLSLEKHLRNSTEQCVEKCLAGINANQDIIYGLVVVPDGLKLIQLEKRQNPTTYFISETDLVTWNQTQNLYAMLEMINNALQ